MSLAVRLFVIDYAFIHSSGKERQQNFPPRSVFFWVLQDGAEVVNAVSDRVRIELLRRIGLEDVLKARKLPVITTRGLTAA